MTDRCYVFCFRYSPPYHAAYSCWRSTVPPTTFVFSSINQMFRCLCAVAGGIRGTALLRRRPLQSYWREASSTIPLVAHRYLLFRSDHVYPLLARDARNVSVNVAQYVCLPFCPHVFPYAPNVKVQSAPAPLCTSTLSAPQPGIRSSVAVSCGSSCTRTRPSLS